MLLYSPLHLFLIPGAILIALGGLLLGLLARGPASVFGVELVIHPMAFGAIAVILGYQAIMLGLFTKVYRLTNYRRSRDDDAVERLGKFLAIDRGLLIGFGLFLIGAAIIATVTYRWLTMGFGQLDGLRALFIALTLVVVGVQTMFSACFLGILSVEHR
jgi:hypothetical protein